MGNRIELTKIQYHTVRPSIPSPFVQIAIVIAHARKITNAWTKWMIFLVLPIWPPVDRGIRNCMIAVGGCQNPEKRCRAARVFQPVRDEAAELPSGETSQQLCEWTKHDQTGADRRPLLQVATGIEKRRRM